MALYSNYDNDPITTFRRRFVSKCEYGSGRRGRRRCWWRRRCRRNELRRRRRPGPDEEEKRNWRYSSSHGCVIPYLLVIIIYFQ